MDSAVSIGQAGRESHQITKRKVEKRLLNNANCKKEFKVMYRFQYECSKKWDFTCKICAEKLKLNNPHYRYGGTWKK